MAATAGKAAKLSLGGTDITAYMDKTGVAQTADKNESTTFGNDSKKYVPGLKDGTGPLEGPFDPAVHADLAPMLATEQTLVYQPAGAASGLPCATVQAILVSYEVDSDVSANSTIKGSLQFTGDLVWTVNA